MQYTNDVTGCGNESLPDPFPGAYRVRRHLKVAWYVLGYYTEPRTDTEWSGMHNVDPSSVVAIMVGDDTHFKFAASDLIPINDDEFCPDCGQIGCCW